MNIQLFEPATFPQNQLEVLLKKYSLEDFYLKSIKKGIDISTFVNFKIANIKKKISTGKVWGVSNSSNELVAIFGLQRSEARSRNFGLNYFEFNPLFNFTSEATKALAIFEREILPQEITNNKIQYLKSKVNASDYFSIAAFCKQNYTFIGTSLNLFLSKEDFKFVNNPMNGLEIVSMEDEYLDEVKAILFQHNLNEDFFDTEIEHNKTHENFFDWLKNFYLTDIARSRNNTEIVILRDKAINEIVGFSCYTKEGGFSRNFELNLITRDLTIIPLKYHGLGYGDILFDEIMRRERKNVELKLMSNNYKALRFNQSNGFKCVGCAHFFRKIFIENMYDLKLEV